MGKHTEAEKIAIVRRVDKADTVQAKTVACQRAGIALPTYYIWKRELPVVELLEKTVARQHQEIDWLRQEIKVLKQALAAAKLSREVIEQEVFMIAQELELPLSIVRKVLTKAAQMPEGKHTDETEGVGIAELGHAEAD